MGATQSATAARPLATSPDASKPDFEADNTSFEMDTTELKPPPQKFQQMSFEERLYYKFTKEPLVPIGAATTVYFLVSGIRSFQKNDTRRSQKMMRGRVMAQLFTIIALGAYAGMENITLSPTPNYDRMIREQKEREELAKQQQQQEN